MKSVMSFHIRCASLLLFSLSCPQLVLAQGAAAPYAVPADACHNSIKNDTRNIQQSIQKQWGATSFQPENLSDQPSDSFKSTDFTKPGCSPEPMPGASFSFVSGQPPKNSQQQNPSQKTTQAYGTKLHTIYGTDYALPGPPSKPNPWLILHQNMGLPNASAVPAQSEALLPPRTNMTLSDTQSAILSMAAAERTGQKILHPQLNTIKGQFQGFTQQVADSASSAQKGGFQAAIGTFSQALINVANEESGTPISGSGPRTISNAVWIVSQMYTHFYLPLAILLLLLGAVLTQFGNTVKNSTLQGMEFSQTDAVRGIVRGACALVLIVLVPIIVSWGIDIGNSLTAAVTGVTQMETLTSWFNQIAPDQSGQTKMQQTMAQMQETSMAATTRAIFTFAASFLNYGILVLLAYQVVIVCYLYLMGPIAAAFYAWPGGIGSLFKPVFNNWLNALLNLVLWRFWWCTIVLCMVTRINWLQDIGMYDPTSQWEPLVYTAFLVMLAYVPFHALDFRPGDMVDQIMDKAKSGQQSS
ncbi:unnamed protein product [Sphagnum balticum]